MRVARSSSRVHLLLLPLALLLAASGCGGVPEKALADAEKARAGAELAARCAPEEYAAAQRMMDRARELTAKKEYAEAENAARTAQTLFEKARARAEARREECLRPAAVAGTDDGLRDPNLDALKTGPEDEYELQRVYFDFDDSTLNVSARSILDKHAGWLKVHPAVSLEISGHCDEMGSTEYNLALGEMRAKSVKRYLTSLGIAEERLSTISYGEEMPIEEGSGADAHRKNRRAEFRRR